MRYLILIAAIFFAWPGQNHADIVSSSWSGDVTSQTGSASDSASSSIGNDSISSITNEGNSFTESTLGWNWDGCNLTAESLITAEKTQNARPGEDHVGTSTLVFQFTIDSTMEFSTAGTFGFDNADPTGDSLSLMLENSSGGIEFSASTTSTAGVMSDSWSGNGLLSAGTYTLTFTTILTETINQQNTALAGWNASSFKLTNTAVPEPNSSFILIGILGWSLARRRSKI